MIDWSKPVDKTDPNVLAEWAKDLRDGVEREGVWQCEAYRWILNLCDKAEASLLEHRCEWAVKHLDLASYHWYQAHK